MVDYFEKADRAAAKIEKFGRDVQIVKNVPQQAGILTENSWFDPDPDAAPDSIVKTTVKAVQIMFSDTERIALLDNKARRYLIASTVQIETDDSIEDDGTTFAIDGIEEVKPGPVSILYRIKAVR